MEMFGWWSDSPPVSLALQQQSARGGTACSTAPFSSNDPDGASTAVLATSHVAKGRLAVLIIASWCASEVAVRLDSVDWVALGLEASSSRVEQPAIPLLQEAKPAFTAADARSHPVTLQPGTGVVLVVRADHVHE